MRVCDLQLTLMHSECVQSFSFKADSTDRAQRETVPLSVHVAVLTSHPLIICLFFCHGKNHTVISVKFLVGLVYFLILPSGGFKVKVSNSCDITVLTCIQVAL